MFTYNFETKEVKNVLDNVELIVNNSSIALKCSAKEATIVEMFDDVLMIAMPISLLKEVIICELTINSEGRPLGVMCINNKKVNFSIYQNILYLRKT